MIRKILFPILAAASFCAAIPLKVGETWVWRVWDRDSTTSTFKIARVLESTPIAQGSVWLVLGRDSLTQHQDTARILERKDGRQSWLRASKNLAFELMPYSAADSDTVVVVGSDTSCQWGQVSSFPELGPSSSYRLADGRLESSTQVRSPWILSRTGSQLPQPKGSWSQEHGMERFVAWPIPTAGIEWRLLAHNDHTIKGAEPTQRIPHVGTRFTWYGVSSRDNSTLFCIGAHGCSQSGFSRSDTGTYTWLVKSVPLDSGEWKRIEVFEESVINPNSNSPTVKRFDVSIRLNLFTGQDFQSSLASFAFHKNWVVKWDDSIAEPANHIQSFHSSSPSLVQWRYFRNEDTLHYLRKTSTSYVASSKDLVTSSFHLTSKDLPPEDSAIILLRSRPLAANLSFRDLIQRHPNLPVSWIRPSGQQGIAPASSLASASFPHRREFLRLEARLPGGANWSSSLVLP